MVNAVNEFRLVRRSAVAAAIRALADELRDELADATVRWLRPPDATAASPLLAGACLGRPATGGG